MLDATAHSVTTATMSSSPQRASRLCAPPRLTSCVRERRPVIAPGRRGPPALRHRTSPSGIRWATRLGDHPYNGSSALAVDAPFVSCGASSSRRSLTVVWHGKSERFAAVEDRSPLLGRGNELGQRDDRDALVSASRGCVTQPDGDDLVAGREQAEAPPSVCPPQPVATTPPPAGGEQFAGRRDETARLDAAEDGTVEAEHSTWRPCHASGSVVHERYRHLIGENVTTIAGRQPVLEPCPHRPDQVVGRSWQSLNSFLKRDVDWQRNRAWRCSRAPRAATSAAKTRAADHPPADRQPQVEARNGRPAKHGGAGLRVGRQDQQRPTDQPQGPDHDPDHHRHPLTAAQETVRRHGVHQRRSRICRHRRHPRNDRRRRSTRQWPPSQFGLSERRSRSAPDNHAGPPGAVASGVRPTNDGSMRDRVAGTLASAT